MSTTAGSAAVVVAGARKTAGSLAAGSLLHFLQWSGRTRGGVALPDTCIEPCARHRRDARGGKELRQGTGITNIGAVGAGAALWWTGNLAAMKAAVATRYGSPDVVHVAEVPRPSPQADELLVRVHATTVNRTDCGFRAAHRG